MVIDTSCSVSLRTNIFFIPDDNHPTFIETVRTSLDALAQTPTGKRLIDKIENAVHPVFIKYGEKSCCGSEDVEEQRRTSGQGCQSLILYNGHGGEYLCRELMPYRKPNFVDLAHELIHAYHNGAGKGCAPTSARCDSMVWTDDDEYHAIMGWPSKKNGRTTSKVTENALLADLGLPERFSHFDSSVFENGPVFYERAKLLAKMYRDFYSKQMDAQTDRSPPPVINCTPHDLGFSKRVAILFRYVVPGELNISSSFTIFAEDDDAPPEDFVRSRIDIEQCPQHWLPKSELPGISLQILYAERYRLSPLEAGIVDLLARKGTV